MHAIHIAAYSSITIQIFTNGMALSKTRGQKRGTEMEGDDVQPGRAHAKATKDPEIAALGMWTASRWRPV